ncbi:MAG: transporter substrate-binding domain-containing protein [Rhodospirillales bacterium]|nr:transporter substrate-binding domain-containing protein [Rhodospirillales bacterium]MDH3918497.1 transporter substrate-binding domain-containing protein [Rhodospirillales bacterium]
MKQITQWIALMALTGLITGPAWAGEVLDRITGTKTLVVSTDAEYPPQSMQKPDGSFAGFDVDVATELAKRLGAEVKFVTPAWEIITGGKWGGRWDASVGSMTPTQQRAKVLDFPAVYYFTPAAFYVHKDSKAQALADLNGKRIGTCGGCTYEDYLNRKLVIDAEGAPPFEYVVDAGEIRTYETDVNAMDDLRLGDGVRLDAGLSALPTVAEAIKNGYPLRVVGEPVFYEPLSVAIDKGDPELAAKIAAAVEDMRKDGTLGKLSEKWYGVDLSSTASE